MKYSTFIILFLFNLNFAISQDYEILNAIDTINHELNGSSIFNIDEDGKLTIQQFEREAIYTFSLKEIKSISQELQLSSLVLKFYCYKEEACFYDVEDSFELQKQLKFSILVLEISPNADAEQIVQELLFIKSRL